MANHLSKLALVFFCASFSFSAAAADKALNTEKEKFSYALGVNLGSNLKQQGVTDIDPPAMAQGIADVLGGGEMRLSAQEMEAAIQAYGQTLQARRAETAKKTKTAGDQYRAENKKKKGVKALPSGIQYEVLTQGKGRKPAATDTVTVHYHGTVVSGAVFDSSVGRGQPATFTVKGVIPGWQEVLPMMPVGSKWRVVIPPELAYGERGAGGAIGPNETLIFEIELLSIKE